MRNPRFQQTIGRLNGGISLMEAAGFILVDEGRALELRAVTSSTDGDGTNKNFKFPSLDKESEAFLYRRKADMEAALYDLDAQLSDPIPVDTKTKHKGSSSAHHQTVRSVTMTETSEVSKDFQKEKSKSNKKLGAEVTKFFGGKTRAQKDQLRMIKEVFSATDVGGDGCIGPGDLMALWKAAGQEHSEIRAVEWVRKIDLDGGDLITFGEVNIHQLSLCSLSLYCI